MTDSATPPGALQPDFPFDYAAHLADERRIGRLPRQALGAPVAVIGTGGSGLAAAYELMRIGCRPVLYEAETDPDGPGGRRLGGRMYSRRLHPADSAVVELGCMRFPATAALVHHYVERSGLHWQPFPDNYAEGVTPNTAVAVDGHRYDVQALTDLYDHNDDIRQAHTRWTQTLTDNGFFRLQEALAARDRATAKPLWNRLLARYGDWSFFRFLTDPAGAGLSPHQARALGTIGIGPIAWDCFYDLAALEVLRVLLAAEGAPVHFLREGISALAQHLWSHRAGGPDGHAVSLEEINTGAPRPAVTALHVGAPGRGVTVHSADGHSQHFPVAVFTPQLHVLETAVRVTADNTATPPFGPRLWQAIRRVSYWPSAHTALVVDAPFWAGTSMDGVTLTDRLPRAAYAYDYGPPRGDGGRRAVLLLSFTWAEDAMKIASSSPRERVEMFVRELADIHPDVADALHKAAATGDAATISWENEPHFRGQCKFSRPGEYDYQWALAGHHMKQHAGFPAVPGEPPNDLYLAGDDTAWTPGWLEYAMASGLNAAWGVLRTLGGTTTPDNPGPGDMWTHPDYCPAPPSPQGGHPAPDDGG
ncbi:flavin monoamine oxidase family protein [Streptomyces huasconensis]|uniref:flavin monoamine oxidase family protein n=1 Tax=Streptomyces huasconensis TaxID=1854574 RepID=UPI00370000B0